MSAGATGAGIDLRSDTVTRPTREMRKAMAEAEVGDDVYAEDPTINRLQELAAERFGREAALYCPSGVMCNQLWLRVLARPGTEVLVEFDSHVVNYEAGAAGIHAGVQFRTIPGERGILAADAVRSSIRPDAFPLTPTSLLWLEQTHNRGGGTYYSVEGLRALRGIADDAGIPIYMDGARIFNAAVASGTDPAVYGGLADGLSFCTSKALGAPVGSLMVGDADAIAEARLWRQRYGGGMRQAGVIAAAAIVALTEGVDRLAEDHENARVIAQAAAGVAPAHVDLEQVQTNIVYLTDVDAAAVVTELAERGVRANAMDARTVRFVTHPDVSAADCREAAGIIAAVLADRVVAAS